MNSYVLSNPIRASAAYAVNGTYTDPTTLVAKVRAPDGSITTYTYGVNASLIRDAVGKYHLDILTTLAGVWAYRFVSTGTAAGANEQEFFVQYSDFGTSG